jgi:hypothetical protein
MRFGQGALRRAAGIGGNLQQLASSRSSAAASDQKTPSPAAISGRSAPSNASSACSIAAGSACARNVAGSHPAAPRRCWAASAWW